MKTYSVQTVRNGKWSLVKFSYGIFEYIFLPNQRFEKLSCAIHLCLRLELPDKGYT